MGLCSSVEWSFCVIWHSTIIIRLQHDTIIYHHVTRWYAISCNRIRSVWNTFGTCEPLSASVMICDKVKKYHELIREKLCIMTWWKGPILSIDSSGYILRHPVAVLLLKQCTSKGLCLFFLQCHTITQRALFIKYWNNSSLLENVETEWLKHQRIMMQRTKLLVLHRAE